MANTKMGLLMVARWAVFEVAEYLHVEAIMAEDHDVTTRLKMDPQPPSGIHTISYRLEYPPTNMWIFIALVGESFLPVSAMVQEKSLDRERYFSFVYDKALDFRRFKELPSMCESMWKLNNRARSRG